MRYGHQEGGACGFGDIYEEACPHGMERKKSFFCAAQEVLCLKYGASCSATDNPFVSPADRVCLVEGGISGAFNPSSAL